MRRGSDATETALAAAGKLWAARIPVDLGRVNGDSDDEEGVIKEQGQEQGQEQWYQRPRPLTSLPKYPFNHKQRYWYDVRCVNWIAKHGQPRSDLLGAPIRDSSSVRPTWKNYLTPAEVPWLLDHKIFGSLILPGAVFIAMAMEACRTTAEGDIAGYEFRDIVWHKPLVFESPDATVETLTQLAPHHSSTKSLAADWTHFAIQSVETNHEASTHCSGLVRLRYAPLQGPAAADTSVSAPKVDLVATEFEPGQEDRLEWQACQRKYSEFRARPSLELNVDNTYHKLQSHGFFMILRF